MKICHSSKCVFECPELSEETAILRDAMEWHKQGFCVHFIFNGEELGFLTYAGKCSKVTDLPDGADYGVVFYCEEDMAYYVSMPEEILNKLPEE